MVAQIETSVYVPEADNDDIPFDDGDWAALYARLARIAGGATRRGPHQGSWLGPDSNLYTEPIFEFEVAVASWFDVPAFLEIVIWIQFHFRQLAIHFKVAGIHETFDGR